jgi:hypothetical protein
MFRAISAPRLGLMRTTIATATPGPSGYLTL